MNLKALREKVKNITDYSPELQQFNDQIDELINDAYYEIWTKKRWNFATKLDLLDLHTDITPYSDLESGASVVNANVIFGQRRITFSHNIGRLKLIDVWEGQPIQIQNQEYTISKIVSGNTLYLTEAFKGDTIVDDTSWIIKKRYYDLPQDCLELLYAGYRDAPYATIPVYGKATGLLPRRDEDYNLRMDLAMDYADAYIPTPSQFIPPAELLDILEGGAGTLPAGYYELCWAFVKEGKIGALSEPKTFQIQEGNSSLILLFQTWDKQAVFTDFAYQSNDQTTPQFEGYRKAIFFNKNIDKTTGERIGLPCWIQLTKGGTRNTADYLEPLIVEDTFGSVTLADFNQFEGGNPRYIERDGQHQQVRFYPRPIGYDTKKVVTGEEAETIYSRQMTIRYYKKPQDILLSTDSPEMPVEFHQLIVYAALEQIYLKLGQVGLSNNYAGKTADAIKGLEKRYVDKIDISPVRGQFTFGEVRGRYSWQQLSHKK